VGSQFGGTPYYTSPSGDILYHHPYAYRKDFSDLKFYPDVPKYVIKVPGVVYPATYVQFSPRDWKMNQTTDNKDIHLPGDFTDLQRDIACYSAVRNLYTVLGTEGDIDLANVEELKKYLDICNEEQDRELKLNTFKYRKTCIGVSYAKYLL
jgi:hypothetical protein